MHPFANERNNHEKADKKNTKKAQKKTGDVITSTFVSMNFFSELRDRRD